MRRSGNAKTRPRSLNLRTNKSAPRPPIPIRRPARPSHRTHPIRSSTSRPGSRPADSSNRTGLPGSRLVDLQIEPAPIARNRREVQRGRTGSRRALRLDHRRARAAKQRGRYGSAFASGHGVPVAGERLARQQCQANRSICIRKDVGCDGGIRREGSDIAGASAEERTASGFDDRRTGQKRSQPARPSALVSLAIPFTLTSGAPVAAAQSTAGSAPGA